MFEATVTTFVTLDLSVAFDTIERTVLARKLEHTVDTTRSALCWICFHLDRRSNVAEIDTGVPQRSALGPLLFSLFFTPLGDLISRYVLKSEAIE